MRSPTSSSSSSWRQHLLLRGSIILASLISLSSLWKSSLPVFLTTDADALPRSKKVTIAYAISVTDYEPGSASLDGAAVLKHSVKRFDSYSTKYNSKFYAFVHINATGCVEELQRIGFEVQVRPTPINVTDIRGPLKEYVEGASCCGSKEFLKLYAYTLTEHPVAVHLDLDTLVLKSLEDLFDAMLEGPSSPARSRIPAMWLNETELPNQIDAYFTRDYNMFPNAGYRKPIETAIQGGFMVVRPNRTVFEEYRDIILEGSYGPDGWGAPKLQFGGTYGSAQVQGLVAYFYGHMRPGTAVELNRCVVNSMADGPKDDEGRCLAPRPDGSCEDCRLTNPSHILSAHFTLCQKPWLCQFYFTRNLCHQVHHAWFQARWELEMERKKVNPTYEISAVKSEVKHRDAPWIVNGTLGYCSEPGSGYRKLPAPP